MDSDHLSDLRRRFRERCVTDLETLREARRSAEGVTRAAVGLTVHRLTGLAGSLGYVELGDLARVVDAGLSQDLPFGEADLDRLEEALAAVSALPA